MPDEIPTTPAPESEEARLAKKEKLEKLLGIQRMKEDVSALREDVHTLGNNLQSLVDAINQARAPQQAQQTQSTQADPNQPISKEEAMLLLKDVGGIAADIFKTYKGVGSQPIHGANPYGDIIMQSLARAFQVHVDDIVSSTLQRLPPETQIKYYQPQFQQTPPSNPTNGFLK